MSGFNNLSGRTEDISVKLRAQNMKNAKDTTKKLEQENRKMEERLKELKMAMNREKEERERQGGGFWQRGQVGTLNSYATEVLHDQSNKQTKSGKKKGVKVLKDEPLDLPTRNSGPGTMKYIAQRSPRLNLGQAGRDSKNKGAKCGQCEERSASLTCVQCSENYCAGCFAAFHLKGALKRHRSVPLHATGPRQCMSPRPTPPASSRSTVSGGASSGDVFYQQADRYGLGGASGSGDATDPPIGGHSLLEGAYNESDSAASFQQALMAWRQGDSTSDSSAESKPKPRQAVVVSPVKSPVTMVEHSTSTTKVAQVMPEVKFTTHSLSYAQRLMLKQHRRTDVGQLTSPRLGSYGSSVTPSSGLTSITPRSSVGRGGGLASDDDDEDFDDEEERVNFQSLYEAMSTSSQHSLGRVSDSNRTVITDVTDSPKDQRSATAESSTYTVLEVSGLEAWEMQRQARIAEKQESSTPSKAKRLSKSRETTRVIEKRAAKSREATRILNCSSITEVDDANGAPLNKNHSHLPATKELTQVLSTKTPPAELPTTEEEEAGGMKKKPPPAAAAPRPKSVKSRPLSSQAMSARSRPSSRAQSRASSRMGVEGLLTKTPSSGLQEIARRMADTSEQYQSPLEGFFLAGVKVEDQVTRSRSRPITPAAQVEKLKVSNKLYAMSPRSWRPGSSLGDSAPPGGLGLDLSALPPANSSPVMRYTYSRQLQGQALEWNPVDSYGTPVPPEETPTPTPADHEAPTPTPADRTAPTPTPADCEAPTPTPADRTAPTPTPADREAPPSTPGSSSSGRKRWGTPDPDARPFSAQRANGEDENNSSSDTRNQKLRPNSSTGGAEPSKRQRRQLPAIDRDLDSVQRARVRRQRTSNDGWTGEDDEQKDPIIRQLSASRTRSWVASQNSFRPGSGHWETEVEEFIRESSDLEGGNELTPRAPSQQLRPVSTRSSQSRSSPMEVSGRASRAIVMDGEDLSKYDADMSTERRRQNTEDTEELDKLEWELASESGRLTADGQISRLDIPETEDDGRSSGSRSGSSTVRLSFDQGYDINTKLRDDELSDGENEQRIRSSMDLVDEEEVRALR